ncbi:hypothetical protein PYW07_001478 [Mythimna separata]|uniref:Spaetzle domain-containing protein n=1 Tax=Mythimna separata TaxID=271217 RepID=A0AAD7YUP9_MYTSE|nr:hypothetical protein PYW07_001478 [Mythimna separata]
MASFTSICFAMMLLVVASEAAPKKFNLKIPDECKGKGFCSVKPEGYDEMQDMIDSLLSPTFIAKNMDDRLGEPVTSEELSPKSDWHNCPYRRTVHEAPYTYRESEDADADYIIQSKFFRQPIETITCAEDIIVRDAKNNSTQCFQHLLLNKFDMVSTCRTSKAERTLLVYDFDTKKPVKKTYNIDCCCTCHVART